MPVLKTRARQIAYGIVLTPAIVIAKPMIAAAQNASNIESQTAATLREVLIRSFQAESKRGTNLFYIQTYKVHGKRVEYHGSIFGVIQEVEANECALKIESELVDLYTGTVDENLPRRTQSK